MKIHFIRVWFLILTIFLVLEYNELLVIDLYYMNQPCNDEVSKVLSYKKTNDTIDNYSNCIMPIVI